MCLFSAVYRLLPDCPLLVLANREEDPARPTAPPRIVQESRNSAAWLGGLDLQAGGTWLGLNRYELLVAVTNRPRRTVPERRRSRGILCRDLLACRSAETALAEINRQRSEHDFAGFNLILLDRRQAVVVEAGDEFRVTPLEAGIHTVTDGRPDDPSDERLQRAQRELERLSARGTVTSQWLQEAERLCALDGRDGPAICLEGPERYTVSSTVIALTRDPAEMRYRYAPGPPAMTDYEDYSHLLRRLLEAVS